MCPYGYELLDQAWIHTRLVVRETVGRRERFQPFGHIDTVPSQYREWVLQVLDSSLGEVLRRIAKVSIPRDLPSTCPTFSLNTSSHGSPVHFNIFIVSINKSSCPSGWKSYSLKNGSSGISLLSPLRLDVPLQDHDKIFPASPGPVLETFAIVQHGVCEGHKLVQSSDDAVRQGWIGLDHLNGTEEERVSTPEITRLCRVNFGSEPTGGVLVIENVVEELLDLRLNCRVVDQNTVGDHPVLLKQCEWLADMCATVKTLTNQ